MRRLFVAAAALAIGLVSIPSHAADKKILAFVVNGRSDFWMVAEAGVRKAQTELPDYELRFYYPEYAVAELQMRILDDLVAAGVAGIIVDPIDPSNMTAALNAVASRTVLYTADGDAPQSNRVAFIGSSNTDLGKEAGKLMMKALPNGGKCVGFVGLAGADSARERINGLKEAIRGSGVELVDVRQDEIDQTRAKRNVENVLASMPDVSCLIGFYSYNTPRIYEVLKKAGKLGGIKIIGFDEDPITLAGVKAGAIVGTVVQQPFLCGYGGMKSLARYADGDRSRMPGNGLIIVPGKVIDMSNVDDVVAQRKQMLGK
jgi:ribose transport system substrate-binding protein